MRLVLPPSLPPALTFSVKALDKGSPAVSATFSAVLRLTGLPPSPRMFLAHPGGFPDPAPGLRQQLQQRSRCRIGGILTHSAL